jgi:hypothetical protein
MSTEDDTGRPELIAGLRDLADFLDEHEELPVPTVWAMCFAVYSITAEEQEETLRLAAEAFAERGFTVAEEHSGQIGVAAKFGPIDLAYRADKRKVGAVTEVTKTVEEWTPPEFLAAGVRS